jgi:hypothetical protein
MKSFLVFMDRVHFSWLGIAAAVALFLFGGCYFWAGQYSQGLVPTYVGGTAVSTFTDCLYFSAVTFSSLGYGDFRPIGISRLIASLEVFVGLAFLGIAIAKLSSARQSYYTARLFSSDAQVRMDKFAIGFNELLQSLNQISDTKEIQQAIVTANVRCVGLLNYIKYEVANGPFFEDVPVRAVRRAIRYLSMLLVELQNRHLSEMKTARGRKLFRNVSLLTRVITKSSRHEFLLRDCELLRLMTTKEPSLQTPQPH